MLSISGAGAPFVSVDGPFGAFGAAKDPAVGRLQRALTLLAFATGDAAVGTKVDSLTGPKTAAATNRAMTKYVTQAPAALRTGKLSPATVAQNAATLSSLIEAEVARRDAAAKTVATTAPVPRAGQRPLPKRPPSPAVALAPRYVRGPAVTRLQHALNSLAQQTGDAKVGGGRPDGIAGPKTAAFTNYALARYVAGAPAKYKTGALSINEVGKNAGTFASLIEGEVNRRLAARAAPPAATPPAEVAEEIEEEVEAEALPPAPRSMPAPAPTVVAPSPVAPPAPIVVTPQPVAPMLPAPVPPTVVVAPTPRPEIPVWWIVGGVGAAVGTGTLIYLLSRPRRRRR